MWVPVKQLAANPKLIELGLAAEAGQVAIPQDSGDETMSIDIEEHQHWNCPSALKQKLKTS